MARKLFERQAIRRRTGALANGVAMVVYSDAAGTVLADISASSGGSAIAGSTVTTANIAGFGPAALQFWGPPDGTDTLYIRVPSDTSLGVQEIEAATDPRLDALESGSATGIPGSIFDAKGDLIAASAADTAARLGVGANDTVLTADSTTSTGLKWSTAGSALETGVVYVENYRAANVTDTATLQAAMTATTAGKTLRFEPGRSYTLTTEVNRAGLDRVTVDGQGAIIKASAATSWGNTSGLRHVLRFRDFTNLTIRGLNFDGTGASLSGTAGWWLLLAIDSTYANNTVATKVSSNVLIEDCDFKDIRAYAFGARLVNGITLRDCTFNQGYHTANEFVLASVTRCDKVKVVDCDFDGGANSSAIAGTIGGLLGMSPGSTSGDPYALAANWLSVMHYSEVGVFTAAPAVSGTSLTTVSYTGANETTTSSPDYASNDWYFLCKTPGSGVGAAIVPTDSIRVTGINEGAKTFQVQRLSGDTTGTPTNWAGQQVYFFTIKTSRFNSDILVQGCSFKNSGVNAGVFLLGCKNFRIIGNQASACGDIGLDAEFCSEGLFEGNTVDNPTGSSGIAMLYFAQDITIKGNRIGRAISAGIHLFSGYAIASDITIEGNVVRGSQIAYTSSSYENYVENLAIVDNIVRGGPSHVGLGIPYGVLINLGTLGADGLLRNVQVDGNILSNSGGWAVQMANLDGFSFRDNLVDTVAFDVILDSNTLKQSTRMVIDGNTFSNIAQGDTGKGIYRSSVAPTDPPRFGRNHWRNTRTSLDGTQPWYLPAGTAATPPILPDLAAFIPTGLSGLILWFAADRIPGVAHGGAVATWPDASGGARHATQATGANQPLLQAGGPNGLPIVHFDGTNDSLATGATAFATSAARTIIAVGRQTAAGSGTPRLWGFADPTAAVTNESGSTWNYYSNQAAGAVSFGGNTANWTVVTVSFTSAAAAAGYLNGVLAASFDPSAGFSTAQALCLGDDFTGAGDLWAGDIAEVVLFNRELTAAERQQVERYLGAKWGVTVA